MASQEEWNGQGDWGPAYLGWWEVCVECDDHYNWFNVEVMGGVWMYGWLHRDEVSECWRAKPMVWREPGM